MTFLSSFLSLCLAFAASVTVALADVTGKAVSALTGGGSDLVFALCAVAAPAFTLWRYRDLRERGFVKSRAQLKKMIDEYGFPEGKLLSPNTRTWTDQEVIAYYEACPSERKAPPSLQPPAPPNADDPRPWDWEGPAKGRRALKKTCALLGVKPS
jgi:hypothetical protein